MAEGVAVLALLLAAIAFQRARGLSRRLGALTQSYWELKYEYTRLRSQVSRLDPDRQEEEVRVPAPSAPAPGSFIPLSSIRKKEQ